VRRVDLLLDGRRMGGYNPFEYQLFFEEDGMSHRFFVLALISLTIGASPVRGESSRSAGPAQRLLDTLQQKQLRHIAAQDPSEPGRYVAAMLVGDGQLLVVSARYAQPALMNERLYRADYEGVYRELAAAGERDGKMFVQDLGRPGLAVRREQDEPYDVVYDAVVKRTAFDGDWKAQKLSKDEYMTACETADERYAKALERLVAALETSATARK
jgi:hypothetical protein